jgi:hypothetical protein
VLTANAIVGRGCGNETDPDHAARAGAVVHHHLLAPVLAHLRSDPARDQVGGTAGRECHDDPHRPDREWLRRRTCCKCQRQESKQ